MPAVILAATTDLFIQSRISEIGKTVDLEATFVTSQEELTQAVKADMPKLAILDLSTNDYDPFTIAKTLKRLSPTLKILGFYPHIKTELKTRAEHSGIDYVVPNSKFASTLKTVLTELKTID